MSNIFDIVTGEKLSAEVLDARDSVSEQMVELGAAVASIEGAVAADMITVVPCEDGSPIVMYRTGMNNLGVAQALRLASQKIENMIVDDFHEPA